MYCTNCGAQNVDTARYCEKCGAPIKVPIETPINPPKHSRSDPVRPTPSREIHATDKTQVGSFKTFFSNNGLQMLVMLIMAALILIFAYGFISSVGQTVSQLSGLSKLPAGLGTAVFMICAILPCILSILMIHSLLPPAGINKSVYAPAFAIIFICIVIAVGSFVFQHMTNNEMSIALSIIFAAYQIPSIISIFLCIVAVALLNISGKRRLRAAS